MKTNLGIIATLALAIIAGTLEFGAMRQQAKDDRAALMEMKAEIKGLWDKDAELQVKIAEMPIVLQSWARSIAAEMRRTGK